MSIEGRKFSIFSITYHDYVSGYALAGPFIFWFMYFIFGISSDNSNFKLVCIIFTIVAIPLLFWRLYFFKTLYRRGVEVTGNITYVGVHSRGNRLEYEYMFQGEKYLRGNAIARGALKGSNYNVGDDVSLVVDPLKPKNAVIKDIYFKEI
jgi:hypothetical protein